VYLVPVLVRLDDGLTNLQAGSHFSSPTFLPRIGRSREFLVAPGGNIRIDRPAKVVRKLEKTNIVVFKKRQKSLFFLSQPKITFPLIFFL